MARKPTSKATEVKEQAELTMAREEAKMRMQDRIEKGLALKQSQMNSQATLDDGSREFSTWNSFNSELLNRMFTTDEFSKEYNYSAPVMVMSMSRPSLGEEIASLYKRIDNKIHRISSIIERLELIPLSHTFRSESSTVDSPTHASGRNRKVFVVHGRDEVAKTNLEIFLHEVGLEPIVLHRQADAGQTIIEKFEKHSEVGYAFILLTPDEVAYLREDESKPDDQRRKELRARPNVLFEFGYFVGKLGRSHVCCLYTGDVTLPSDVHGMIYKKYQTNIEEIAYGITKDLKAAGYIIT